MLTLEQKSQRERLSGCGMLPHCNDPHLKSFLNYINFVVEEAKCSCKPDKAEFMHFCKQHGLKITNEDTFLRTYFWIKPQKIEVLAK